MSHYFFNVSKKGAAKGKTLREQAGELLRVKMRVSAPRGRTG